MKYKILVVEDEEKRFRDTLNYLQKTELDLEVVRALSVNGALRKLGGSHYDLIILDNGLGADSARGYELLPQMRANPSLRGIPVIVLSAIGDEGVKKLCINEGAKAFFSRISEEFRKDFLPKVKELLEQRSNG